MRAQGIYVYPHAWHAEPCRCFTPVHECIHPCIGGLTHLLGAFFTVGRIVGCTTTIFRASWSGHLMGRRLEYNEATARACKGPHMCTSWASILRQHPRYFHWKDSWAESFFGCKSLILWVSDTFWWCFFLGQDSCTQCDGSRGLIRAYFTSATP